MVMNYLLEGGIKTLCDKKTSFIKLRREERRVLYNQPDLEKCVFGPKNEIIAEVSEDEKQSK